jgi:dUTP pyrophosphatase
MLKVKFKKLHDNVKLPVKGSLDAACFDVYAHSKTFIGSDKIKYGLGFATEIPIGYRGVIIPRSNLVKHNWSMNNNLGVIDSDYRGEWMVVFTSIRDNGIVNEVPYMEGDRIAQIYFEKVVDVQFEEVKELNDSIRGEGGFGSTGVTDRKDISYAKPENVTYTKE